MPPTDAATYPSGQPAGGVDPHAAHAQGQAAPKTLTEAEQETVDTLYAELKPMAIDSARSYVMARTPAQFQEAMTAKIDADFPPPPPPPPA